MKRGVWMYALGGMVALAGSVVFASTIYAESERLSDADVKTSVQRLRKCANDAEKIIACGEEEVHKLLQGRTGSDVMAILEKEVISVCHRMGHIVGRQVYEQTKNVERALDQCTYSCGGACFHGITGAAFLEAVGVSVEDPSEVHISLDDILRKGKELCTSATNCHGIGHMLFQIYNEFETPLSVCDDIARGFAREDCYRGIFMEHADAVSSHDILLRGKRMRDYKSTDLLYPCDTVDTKYRLACFRYQPRVQDQIFDATDVGPRSVRDEVRRTACESLPDTHDRISCFRGIGRHFLQSAISDPYGVSAWCQDLDTFVDRNACSDGMVHSMVAYGYPDKAYAYCDTLDRFRERFHCRVGVIGARIVTSME